MADSYHVLEHSQGSGKTYGTLFDPLNQWGNPRSLEKASTSSTTAELKQKDKKIVIEATPLLPTKREDLESHYEHYLTPLNPPHPLLANGMSQFKEARDFALAAHIYPGYTADMIHDAFRYLMKFDKKPINRDEYLVWFDLLARTALGNGPRVPHIQAEAALQEGLTALLERFRLDPSLLPAPEKLASAGGQSPLVGARGRSPLVGPTGRSSAPDPVVAAAKALLTVTMNHWKTSAARFAEMIRAIPFAQEMHIPWRGLGLHLGDKAQFRGIVKFDPKLAALSKAAESDSLQESEQESLVEALVAMAKPSTSNSLQTKTASAVLLHHLSTAKETHLQAEGLRRLATEWLQRIRDGPPGGLVSTHDHALLKAIQPNSGEGP